MKGENLNVEDRLAALRQKANMLRPVPVQASDPAARTLDSLDRGEELKCKKFFQGAGVSYQPGQDFIPEGWSKARISQLAAHGFIIPAKEYEDSLAFAAAADLLDNKLQPLLATLQQARQHAQAAATKVAVKSGELLQAQQDASTSASQVAYWQDQLDQAMKGEDITAIFG